MGLFRYKRLLFGLSCAPEMFQRIMEEVLSGLPGVFVYLDDLLVWGSSDENLKRVLHRLNDRGFTLNIEKCVFRQPEVPLTGHIISEGTIPRS